MPSVRISYKAVVQLRHKLRKMSERHLGSYTKSGSMGSSRGSTWRKQRHKKREDRNREQEEKRSSLEKGSYQTIGLFPVLQGTGDLTREIRNLSGYADW